MEQAGLAEAAPTPSPEAAEVVVADDCMRTLTLGEVYA